MKLLDSYVRSVYFVNGKIGVIRISPVQFLISVINLPLFIIWFIWKGLLQ